MKEKLSDLCREQKQAITPHKTNQDVAENTDLSVGTVSQFFRGDIKNPSVYTVGPICREMGVSMDEYFGIPHDEPAESSEPPDAEKLRAEKKPAAKKTATAAKAPAKKTATKAPAATKKAPAKKAATKEETTETK